jgi:transcriptional regulator with XRE-family HTH domain
MKYLEYRLKINLTQQELASKIGISKTHISEIENGIKTPSVKVLVHLAATLNTCPCKLLEFRCDHD